MTWSGALTRGRLLSAIVAVAITAFGSGLFFLYFQAVFVARDLAKREPQLQATLLDLPDKTISTAPGKALSYLGYSFEVPWSDVDATNVKIRGNTAVIPFHSGITMVFMTNPSREILDTLEKPSPEIMHKRFCAVYGVEACDSDYGFFKLVFDTRPNDISWFAPRGRNEAELFLLLLKMGLLRDKSGTFLIQTQRFSGFQFGDLAKNGGHGAFDDLYSHDKKLEFIFGRKAGQLSQAEINRVIQTLRFS